MEAQAREVRAHTRTIRFPNRFVLSFYPGTQGDWPKFAPFPYKLERTVLQPLFYSFFICLFFPAQPTIYSTINTWLNKKINRKSNLGCTYIIAPPIILVKSTVSTAVKICIYLSHLSTSGPRRRGQQKK